MYNFSQGEGSNVHNIVLSLLFPKPRELVREARENDDGTLKGLGWYR